jgi:hypothetical protein
MERLRRPFQGVANILRFNWHFYVLTMLLIGSCWIVNAALGARYTCYAGLLTAVVSLPVLISLSVSCYVYDVSNLYTMPWLNGMLLKPGARILNIHAGLDEFSVLLKKQFPEATLEVFDFFDPQRHSEPSIRRARNAYPAFPGTKPISSTLLPLPDDSADLIIIALAAHEIRDEHERTLFFQQLTRTIKADGRIAVTEHLRDLPNFLAYTIGFFHFLPYSSWRRVFRNSQLEVRQELKCTPLITTFMLAKNGTTS